MLGSLLSYTDESVFRLREALCCTGLWRNRFSLYQVPHFLLKTYSESPLANLAFTLRGLLALKTNKQTITNFFFFSLCGLPGKFRLIPAVQVSA